MTSGWYHSVLYIPTGSKYSFSCVSSSSSMFCALNIIIMNLSVAIHINSSESGLCSYVFNYITFNSFFLLQLCRMKLLFGLYNMFIRIWFHANRFVKVLTKSCLYCNPRDGTTILIKHLTFDHGHFRQTLADNKHYSLHYTAEILRFKWTLSVVLCRT